MDDQSRCEWSLGSQNYITYHDQEWGIPVYDDRVQFEFLILEGAQAGLSWSTILNRRDGYRQVFDSFDPVKIASYDQDRIDAILKDTRIIRNKLKVHSTVTNAQNFLKVQEEFGSFCDYIWSFVGGRPVVNKWKSLDEIPATSPESDALSKDLKSRGFKFVGSTIIYAHMQAIGLVNDHVVSCFRYKEVLYRGGKCLKLNY